MEEVAAAVVMVETLEVALEVVLAVVTEAAMKVQLVQLAEATEQNFCIAAVVVGVTLVMVAVVAEILEPMAVVAADTVKATLPVKVLKVAVISEEIVVLLAVRVPVTRITEEAVAKMLAMAMTEHKTIPVPYLYFSFFTNVPLVLIF